MLEFWNNWYETLASMEALATDGDNCPMQLRRRVRTH